MSISPPVVFLPGTLCDERVWMPVWRRLDLEQKAYVPLQWAEDLAQMLALSNDRLGEFDEPVHLVGFSLGGYIAALTAIEQPQKVASLTLLGFSAFGLTDEETQQRQAIIKHIQQGKYRGFSEGRLKQFISPDFQQNAAVRDVMISMSDDLGGNVLAKQMATTTPRQDLSRALANCDFPINIVGGELDQIVPLPALQKLHQVLPSSQLQVFEKTGHMLTLEQPEQVAAQLSQWLSAK